MLVSISLLFTYSTKKHFRATHILFLQLTLYDVDPPTKIMCPQVSSPVKIPDTTSVGGYAINVVSSDVYNRIGKKMQIVVESCRVQRTRSTFIQKLLFFLHMYDPLFIAPSESRTTAVKVGASLANTLPNTACALWSSLCAKQVVKNPRYLHADSEDSDQTGQMPRLI